MKWSMLLDILYYMAQSVQWICPFGMQEPLLEPRLSPILSSIKQFNPNVATTIYSNMSLYPKQMWREIINLQTLDNLNISFYGTDKRTYEKLQPPLNYLQVQRNIKKLVKLRTRMGWLKPKITMHLMVTKETVGKINQFAEKWRHIVDAVGFVHYDNWTGLSPNWNNGYEEQIWSHTTPHASQRVPCHRLWTTMMIHSDGEVVPCCLDHNAVEPCGNVGDDIQTWFNSPKLNELRTQHIRGEYDEIPLCRKCSIWRREESLEWQMNWRHLVNVPNVIASSPR